MGSEGSIYMEKKLALSKIQRIKSRTEKESGEMNEEEDKTRRLRFYV